MRKIYLYTKHKRHTQQKRTKKALSHIAQQVVNYYDEKKAACGGLNRRFLMILWNFMLLQDAHVLLCVKDIVWSCVKDKMLGMAKPDDTFTFACGTLLSLPSSWNLFTHSTYRFLLNWINFYSLAPFKDNNLNEIFKLYTEAIFWTIFGIYDACHSPSPILVYQ